MAKKFGEIQVGTEFATYCLCKQTNVGTTSNHKAYINMTLFDGQTEILGKKWDHEGPIPPNGSALAIKGQMVTYNGKLQIAINQWRPAKAEECSPSDFLPHYEGDTDGLFAEIWSEVEKISDRGLQSVVCSILTNNKDAFITAPAASGHHHAYIGGLVQHTSGVCKLALQIAQLRPDYIDYDLLRAGGILHDIGKIISYSWENTIDYSDDGRFLDHIVLGIEVVKKQADEAGVPWEMTRKLLHIIASHHQKLDWGSPVEPVLKEAFIISQADQLDASLQKIDIGLKTASENGQEWADIKDFKWQFKTPL